MALNSLPFHVLRYLTAWSSFSDSGTKANAPRIVCSFVMVKGWEGRGMVAGDLFNEFPPAEVTWAPLI